jgi:thiol-disulfide isomerase/thioredoxin
MRIIYAAIAAIAIISVVAGIQNYLGDAQNVPRIVGENNPFDPSAPRPVGPPEVPQITNEVTITVYTAEWCPACHTYKPELEKLEKLGYTIKYIDVDKEDTGEEKITSLPTTTIKSDTGKEIRFEGYKDSDEILKIINELTSNSEPN